MKRSEIIEELRKRNLDASGRRNKQLERLIEVTLPKGQQRPRTRKEYKRELESLGVKPRGSRFQYVEQLAIALVDPTKRKILSCDRKKKVKEKKDNAKDDPMKQKDGAKIGKLVVRPKEERKKLEKTDQSNASEEKKKTKNTKEESSSKSKEENRKNIAEAKLEQAKKSDEKKNERIEKEKAEKMKKEVDGAKKAGEEKVEKLKEEKIKEVEKENAEKLKKGAEKVKKAEEEKTRKLQEEQAKKVKEEKIKEIEKQKAEEDKARKLKEEKQKKVKEEKIQEIENEKVEKLKKEQEQNKKARQEKAFKLKDESVNKFKEETSNETGKKKAQKMRKGSRKAKNDEEEKDRRSKSEEKYKTSKEKKIVQWKEDLSKNSKDRFKQSHMKSVIRAPKSKNEKPKGDEDDTAKKINQENTKKTKEAKITENQQTENLKKEANKSKWDRGKPRDEQAHEVKERITEGEKIKAKNTEEEKTRKFNLGQAKKVKEDLRKIQEAESKTAKEKKQKEKKGYEDELRVGGKSKKFQEGWTKLEKTKVERNRKFKEERDRDEDEDKMKGINGRGKKEMQEEKHLKPTLKRTRKDDTEKEREWGRKFHRARGDKPNDKDQIEQRIKCPAFRIDKRITKKVRLAEEKIKCACAKELFRKLKEEKTKKALEAACGEAVRDIFKMVQDQCRQQIQEEMSKGAYKMDEKSKDEGNKRQRKSKEMIRDGSIKRKEKEENFSVARNCKNDTDRFGAKPKVKAVRQLREDNEKWLNQEKVKHRQTIRNRHKDETERQESCKQSGEEKIKRDFVRFERYRRAERQADKKDAQDKRLSEILGITKYEFRTERPKKIDIKQKFMSPIEFNRMLGKKENRSTPRLSAALRSSRGRNQDKVYYKKVKINHGTKKKDKPRKYKRADNEERTTNRSKLPLITNSEAKRTF